jgi:hypothetical protein
MLHGSTMLLPLPLRSSLGWAHLRLQLLLAQARPESGLQAGLSTQGCSCPWQAARATGRHSRVRRPVLRMLALLQTCAAASMRLLLLLATTRPLQETHTAARLTGQHRRQALQEMHTALW